MTESFELRLDAPLDTGFLFSASWWKSSLKIVSKLTSQFYLIAFLIACSNGFAASADYILRSSTVDMGNTADLNQLLKLAGHILGATTLSLILGFAALSSCLVKLTSLSRMQLLGKEPEQFADCLVDVRAKAGYLSSVWLVALLFLALPAVPASALAALSILGGADLHAFGEPLITIPSWTLMPMALAQAILFSISLVYCFILTVLSSSLSIAPPKVALFSAKLMLRQFLPVALAGAVVVFINCLISGPVIIYLSYFAPTAQKQDLFWIVFAQVWLGISSYVSWPLSLLVFVRLLQNSISKGEETS